MNKLYLKNKYNQRKYYLSHREEILKRCKLYRDSHKLKRNSDARIYRKTHKENRDKVNLRRRINYAKNINCKMANNLRSRLHMALKGNSKLETTMRLVGCSIELLKSYLETKFVLGMSWDNYGKWEIDHIIPCSRFNLSILEEQFRCFHYSNLQPLWAAENRRKGDKC